MDVPSWVGGKPDATQLMKGKEMNSRTIIAIAVASAFAVSAAGTYAQQDEKKDEKKPYVVSQSDEKEPKKPEQSDEKEPKKPDLVSQSDEKEPKKPDLISQSDEKEPKKPDLAG